LGFITKNIELPKSYKMFRTPKYIAELATRFILGDPYTRREFEEQGYTEEFQFPNNLENSAEILQSVRLELDIIERVNALLSATYSEEDIMIITSDSQIESFKSALNEAEINYVVGESEKGSALSLVDFMNVKGLEKEVVFVSGIEDIYNRSKSDGIFDDEENKVMLEQFSRRKIYISITRPLEQLIIYYQDFNNKFIQELLSINNQIHKKRISIK